MVEADPFVQSIMGAYPCAILGEIKTLASVIELPAIHDEVEGGGSWVAPLPRSGTIEVQMDRCVLLKLNRGSSVQSET